MGIFQQFPYTNFHEMNLDWILNQLRGIDKKLDEALDLIQNKLADLINEEDVKEKIDELIAEYLTPEEIDNIVSTIIETVTNETLDPLVESIENTIETTPFDMPIPDYIPISNGKFNLMGDAVNKVNHGSCSDGKYFYSYRANISGIGAGMLDVYDMNDNHGSGIDNWEYKRSVPLDLGHGNGLYYKEDENSIYAVAMKSGDPEIEDRRVFVIDVDTLTITRTFELEFALMGLCYNTILEKWVGYYVVTGDNSNYLVFWDKDFNLIETYKCDLRTNTRVGLFADNDYIYILQTGNYGTYSTGQISESRISIYDWNKNYRGDTIFHNAEEFESLAWTGKAHVATFYGTYNDGLASYASFIQLFPSEYMAFSWYRTHWGQNQITFDATTDNDLFMSVGEIPSYDKRVPFTATHLEIDLSPTMAGAPQTLIIPRAYGNGSRNTWHTITLTLSNRTIHQSIRFDQSNGIIRVGSFVTKTIMNDGTTTTDTDTNPYYKIRQVRACNYTMQPIYKSYSNR